MWYGLSHEGIPVRTCRGKENRVIVQISQLLLWTLNDERFSFLTTLVNNNLSDVSTRCSSPPQSE